MGKNINYYLIDDVPNGRIKCTLSGWIGAGYRIPKEYIAKCATRQDFKNDGIYFLIGNSDTSENPTILLGRPNTDKNLYMDLNESTMSVEFSWNEAVVFTLSEGAFLTSEISYLENVFYKLACQSEFGTIIRKTKPEKTNISEEKESELKDYVIYAKLIMQIFGYNFLTDGNRKKSRYEKNSTVVVKPTHNLELIPGMEFILKQKDADANGILAKNGFLLLAGSKICLHETKACPYAAKKLRKEYAELIKNGVVQQDIPFGSVSGAAGFVTGSSVNGNLVWKNRAGVCLGDYIKPLQKDDN